MLQWQARKISHEVAHRDLLACRDMAAQRGWQFVAAVREAEAQAEYQRSQALVLGRAPSLLGTFRSHPVIDAWLEQFQPEMVERSLRFKPLLLRGESRSGKSMKASSIFGFGKTLAVNCQGVAPALPSIRAFDRMQHKCILWDEVSPEQVLANKMVFQSGPMPVTLAQSACNGFAYDKWLFGIPHILCSNIFPLDAEPGPKPRLSAEDIDWLNANLFVADLLPGEKWYADVSDCSRLPSSPEHKSVTPHAGWFLPATPSLPFEY